MTQRIACPPAPGPLEESAAHCDDLFTHAAQRRSFRAYLAGLLLPRDRTKTLTALAGAAPSVEAPEAPVQRLQSFLSESVWDAEAVNARRRALTWAAAALAPHADGVLVIDETGDRKDGTKTAHVAPQYLGSGGKIANGIVSVTSLWADERVHYPLHVVPSTPAARLPVGPKDPALRTKPQLAVDLVRRAREAGVSFRAVVADCIYGENATFEGSLWGAQLPYVLAVRPSRGSWGPEAAAHTPQEAAQEVPWTSPEEPGGWTAVERRFRDGHRATWWAADLERAGYGPSRHTRLVAATSEPATRPVASTWYLLTNLPHPEQAPATEVARPAADLAEIVRLYGLRQWVEQGYTQVKGALGWADFQVRADRAIRRHWQLVCCAFSFCWWAYLRREEAGRADARGDEVLATGPGASFPPSGPRPRGRAGAGAAAAVVAAGAAAGAGLAGPVDHAVALLAGVVECAPAPRLTSAA
jgi:DDE superfamily endonuclease